MYIKNINLNKGKQYEEFLKKRDKEMGLIIDVYEEIDDQYNIGESTYGYEMKFDDRLKDTNNIYIETAEKTNALNLNYISSGIYRNDNTWLWLIGDFDITFFFSKKTLQRLENEKIPSEEYPESGYLRMKIKTKTSQGYTMDINDAFRNCEKVIFHTKKYIEYIDIHNFIYTDLTHKKK